MFNIRKEEDYYSHFVTAILKTGSDRWEKWMEDAKTFLKGLIPKFSMGSDPMNDFSVSLDWKEVKKNPEEILISQGSFRWRSLVYINGNNE